MRLTLLLLLLCQVLAGYRHIIKTNFKDENNLINVMYSKKFFNKYLELVGSENTIYTPSIEDEDNLCSPQEIEYISSPNISFLKIINKVNIKHKWNRENNILLGNINSYYTNFDLKIYCRKEEELINLIFEAKINRKLFFIPNVALKYALNDFGNRFNEIISLLSDNVC